MDSALQNILCILNQKPIHSDNINPEELFRIGAHHRINGQVQLSLKNNYPDETKLLDFFKERRRFQQHQSIKQASAAIALNKFAQEHGKRIVFLKGIPLSQQLYHDITVRSSSDIDVLVQINDVLWFHNILKQSGYQSFNLPEIPKKYEHIIMRSQKDIVYYHPIKKIVIELHWKLSLNNQFSNLQYNTLLMSENTKLVFIDKNALEILSDPFNFVYLCYHAEKHYCKRLHWMYDTLLYANQIQADAWEAIFEIAEKNNVKVHLHYLIHRWKIFFPVLSQNIPVPTIKKIWSYPALVFNNTTLTQRCTIEIQKIISNTIINKTLKNMLVSVMIRVTRNPLKKCIKYHLPVFLFYLSMPVWIGTYTVTIFNTAKKRLFGVKKYE